MLPKFALTTLPFVLLLLYADPLLAQNCGADYNAVANHYGGRWNAPLVRNNAAHAGLQLDGSISAWGASTSGGTGAPAVTGFTALYSTIAAFAAMRSDGSLVAWGDATRGGTTAAAGAGYVNVYGSFGAFVAQAEDGSLSAWGNAAYGGSGAPTGSGYREVFSSNEAFAALTPAGQIVTWGHATQGGSGGPSDGTYRKLSATAGAFAALRTDGSISAWGDATRGGTGAPSGSAFRQIYSANSAFASLHDDGSIVAWGHTDHGGTGAPVDSGYNKVFPNAFAFAALKPDGGIFAWGRTGHGGDGAPGDSGYIDVVASDAAFAAIKNDGSISAWGSSFHGGTGAPSDSGYTKIYSSSGAFAALKADGSINAWGYFQNGGTGEPTDSGYVQIVSNGYSFVAVKEDGTYANWGNVNSGGSGGPATGDFINIDGAQLGSAVDQCDLPISLAFHELVEDIAGNANGVTVSNDEINSVVGVSGALNGLEDDYTAAFQLASYEASVNPTVREIQDVIDETNAVHAALLALVEDIAGNADGVSISAEELNTIPGVTGALNTQRESYTAAFQTAAYVDNTNPSPAEIQAIVDTVNEIAAARAELVEDIAGNANGQPIYSAALNSIPGITGAIGALEAKYTVAFQAADYGDRANPMSAEIQALIDRVNSEHTAWQELIEDIAGNANGTAVSAEQLNLIPGISGALPENQLAYLQRFQSGGFADPNDPSTSEVQAIIDHINAANDGTPTNGEQPNTAITVGTGLVDMRLVLFLLCMISLKSHGKQKHS